MREIKFRGKRVDNDDFVRGDLIWKNGICYISCHFSSCRLEVDVYSKTIGQFTGLLDKNGKEIYEGDIIDYPPGLENYHYVVEWCLAGFQLVMYKKAGANCAGISNGMNSCYFEDSLGGEIIGNIYENPELLEQQP